jgi:aryl-alcohol dehydrogenase-like predicted oxidoreductase
MHFGEALGDERLETLLRPGAGIDTVLSADVYGEGAADALLGRALVGLARDSYSLVGAVGHDFYEGERQGPKGFPRFTDPALRAPGDYAGYLRMATVRSLERIGAERFDLLLLHNPDRTGFESGEVWDAMAGLRDAGLCDAIGVAPGPANGFTLDLIGCLERYGELIDWAMIILNPLEPWPGELVLDAAASNDVRVITRVVDYGGLFWGDLTPDTPLGESDHRRFRPDGWIEQGQAKLAELRPRAERAGLTPLQLACAWNLAHPAVDCVVPTLIQEAGAGARPVEDKRAELAALPAATALGEAEIAAIRAIGDNTGSMKLKGASPEHDGPEAPDRWALTRELEAVAGRWDVDPRSDLAADRVGA